MSWERRAAPDAPVVPGLLGEGDHEASVGGHHRRLHNRLRLGVAVFGSLLELCKGGLIGAWGAWLHRHPPAAWLMVAEGQDARLAVLRDFLRDDGLAWPLGDAFFGVPDGLVKGRAKGDVEVLNPLDARGVGEGEAHPMLLHPPFRIIGKHLIITCQRRAKPPVVGELIDREAETELLLQGRGGKIEVDVEAFVFRVVLNAVLDGKRRIDRKRKARLAVSDGIHWITRVGTLGTARHVVENLRIDTVTRNLFAHVWRAEELRPCAREGEPRREDHASVGFHVNQNRDVIDVGVVSRGFGDVPRDALHCAPRRGGEAFAGHGVAQLHPRLGCCGKRQRKHGDKQADDTPIQSPKRGV